MAHGDGILSTTVPASFPTSFIIGTHERGLAKPDIAIVVSVFEITNNI